MASKQESERVDNGRRQFVGGAAGLAAITVASGFSLVKLAQARSADKAVSSEQRWGLLIDASKCAEGCDDCVSACNKENGLTGFGRPETDAQWIRKVKLKDRLSGNVTTLPMLCQHCEHPPCVDVCPTGASFRREDGIVLVDKHICIGCRYCMMACPYKARSFIHESIHDQVAHSPRGKGTVESCTLCVHRVDEGKSDPACVEACTKAGHGAMLFGDLNDPESTLAKRLKSEPSVQVRADLDLNVGVRYQGV